MLRPVWLLLSVDLCSLLVGLVGAPSPVEPPERSRAYTVLRGQNLGERRGLEGGGVGPAHLPLGAAGAWAARGRRRGVVVAGVLREGGGAGGASLGALRPRLAGPGAKA